MILQNIAMTGRGMSLFAKVEVASQITKTGPCNEDPLAPHFYIVKIGFTGVYIIFLNFLSKDFHFYCRKILQYIARACLRNVEPV